MEPARQTPPGARPNRDDAELRLQPVCGPVVRVGCTRRPATGVPDEWSSGGNAHRTRLTDRLAFLLSGRPLWTGRETPVRGRCDTSARKLLKWARFVVARTIVSGRQALQRGASQDVYRAAWSLTCHGTLAPDGGNAIKFSIFPRLSAKLSVILPASSEAASLSTFREHIDHRASDRRRLALQPHID